VIVELSAPFVRLAYPLRSAAFATLADRDEDLRALSQLAGSAASYIQRPFDVPTVSRFSDGTFGVLYVADTLGTAVRETAYHLKRFFTDGNAPEQDTRKKQLEIAIKGRVRDIRRKVDKKIARAIYDPNDYRESQAFGREQHLLVGGLHYDSVRNQRSGHCVGAFVPDLVAKASIVGDVSLVWDGRNFVEQHQISPLILE